MLLIIAAAMLWGTTGTAQGFAPPQSTPSAIGVMRLIIGGGALFAISLYKNPHFLKGILTRDSLCGGLFVAAYQICFFWGVSLAGVATGTLVAIGSAPAFAGILEIVIFKRVPSVRWYPSTLLALVGCSLLYAGNPVKTINPFGILLAAGAGFSYAVYALVIKKMLPGRDAVSVTAVVFCIGALFSLPIIAITEFSWIVTPSGIVVSLHLGLFATALSYFLFSKGLVHVPVSQAVTLSLAEPLTAALLGIMVLGESLSITGGLGLVLIFSGLLLLALPAGSKRIEQIKTGRD